MTEQVMGFHADSSNEQLLDEWALLRIQSNELHKVMDKIEFVLDQRMKANRARTIPHGGVACEMGPPTPIIDRLIGLKEVIGSEQFYRAFTPAHTVEKTVEVDDKINMTVVNGWAKQGDHIREIIDYGTDHETAKLVIKLKKPDPLGKFFPGVKDDEQD